jgi:hypothetical protein
MRCSACGYPNYEEATTCFSCNAKIEGRPQSPKPKPSVSVEPEVRTKMQWLRMRTSERWEIWLIASALGVVSAIMPWESAFYRDTLTNTPALTVSANLFDLVLADNLVIVSLVVIYILGFAASMLLSFLVVIPIGSLVLLAYTMPQYMLSQLPPSPPNYLDDFYTSSGLGFGYLLAWISLIILSTFLLEDLHLRYTKGYGKDQAPSEARDAYTFDWLWVGWGKNKGP